MKQEKLRKKIVELKKKRVELDSEIEALENEYYLNVQEEALEIK